MYDDYITKLDDLIYDYVGRSKTIVNKDIKKLTAPGDNYCSLMLKIDVKLKNLKNHDDEMLYMVAKCRNKGVNGFMDTFSPWQFKKEIEFFAKIVPALEEFQREQGAEGDYDIFPTVIAVRRNLHGNDDEIDDDAVILMENLIKQGYANIERQRGFDLQGAKIVLKDIASFHALPVALKLQKPDIFESTVKKYSTMKPDMSGMPKGYDKPPLCIRLTEEIEECKPYMDDIKRLMYETFQKDNFLQSPCTEPFASILHADLWVNNTMQKMEDGKIVQKNKIIDFQMYKYGNPTVDVIFFLLSSVRKEVVKENFENLIALYEDSFFKVLEDLKCDTTSLQRNFSEQVGIDASSELLHLLFMTIPIFGRKEEAALDFEADPMDMVKESSVTQEAKDQISFVVTEFGRRGWIKA